MNIQLSTNTLMKMMPGKSKFPMQQTKQQDKAFDLSMINGKITRDIVQISKDAKKAASNPGIIRELSGSARSCP